MVMIYTVILDKMLMKKAGAGEDHQHQINIAVQEQNCSRGGIKMLQYGRNFRN